ncbi:MAG: hypothetical protein MI861_24840 [Pirellulales bacterium]|nr:hypothetical protein [Pirellulales bacterium]
MINPFAVTTDLGNERGVFGQARLLRSRFLYREIVLESPAVKMIYTGWWFRQKITFDAEVVWFRISWLSMMRHAEFRLPASVDPAEPPGRVEISFDRRLAIRRFRLWIDEKIVYDEVD